MTGHLFGGWNRLRQWVLLAACTAALVIAAEGTALGAEAHVFDPALSLAGDCSEEPVDPIPDPGCPGGEHPPAGRFSSPGGVATDSYGDIYVASLGGELANKTGRIDVFDSSGHFITEVADPNGPGPMAIDSDGNLYVSNHFKESEENIVRYSPSEYKPAAGIIKYNPTPTTIIKNGFSNVMGLALEPTTQQLWVKFGTAAELFSSAKEGNELVETVEGSGGFGGEGLGIAADEADGILYGVRSTLEEGRLVEAFELAPPHTHLFTIAGTAVPNEKFVSTALYLAVDEGTGNLFVFDGEAKKVYEFNSSGDYLSTTDVNVGSAFQYVFKSSIAIDNGENSSNGALNPKGRYLYVPSGHSKGNSFAFGPSNICAPEVKETSVVNVGEEEAELQASIEPCGAPTHYTFEYTTEESFEAEGFAGASIAGEGEIPAGNAPVAIAAPATGLQPETAYRFRVVAVNEVKPVEAEGGFATYPASEPFPPCPNDAFRTGLSAPLPDCRAYELVTPPDTNARSPHGGGANVLGTFFATPEASPQGDAVSFEIEGGTIPGNEAVGSFAGDPYLSNRGEGGWSTAYVGPSGLEAPSLLPGSHSPDQGYSFWESSSSEGTAEIEGHNTTYVRYPDGHSELIGRGSLGTDPRARGKLISEDGSHTVFISPTYAEGSYVHPAVQLEPNAPPEGTQAIYDRTSDEVTHVVSLLPGNVTPAAGEEAFYEGASFDGKGVAFKIGSTLYLRYENEETYEVAEGVTFAGIAEGGNRVFYLQGGNLWRLDAKNDERTRFTTAGNVIPVRVSVDGSTAYFVSSAAIAGEPNPNGAEPVEGQENLYRSDEGAISFVGTVTEEDVLGSKTEIGLGRWDPRVVSFGEAAEDPSRTTTDGSVLLFESRADLVGYDPEGHTEVYRYDASGNELTCLSCNPTLAQASGEASLQSMGNQIAALEALGPFAIVENLSPDGRRAVFQTTEALVPADTDGLQDVYEWEAQGVGSCGRPQGCIYLISSGHSFRPDYLYAVSDSGNDVFFRSADILLPSDAEETASIYDARVDGGFAEECEGQDCNPLLPPPSPAQEASLPNLATRSVGQPETLPKKRCPKGKRRVRRHGKTRCLKKRHRHHHRGASSRKGGGK